jgi:hypothetical protein
LPTGFSDKDTGLKALLARCKASKLAITVGVHSEEGAGAYPGGATVSDVATWNEYGTARIPPRPFISGWFDANTADIRAKLNAAGEKIFKGADPVATLDVTAQYFAGQVQKGISAGIPPANAESTQKGKTRGKVGRGGNSRISGDASQGGTPLIDSGQLRSSIRGRVVSR